MWPVSKFTAMTIRGVYRVRTDLGTDCEPHPVGPLRIESVPVYFLDRHWSNSTSN